VYHRILNIITVQTIDYVLIFIIISK